VLLPETRPVTPQAKLLEWRLDHRLLLVCHLDAEDHAV
jgi:hypothetical protein